MADTKLTALGAIGTLGNDDLFYVVDAPGGTPLSKQVTADNLKTYAAVLDKYSADALDRELTFQKSRNATNGSHTIVQDGDDLGTIRFQGSNSTTFDDAAFIMAEVDGTPGVSSDMPGRLVFGTTVNASSTAVERMRIDNAGKVIISTGVSAQAPQTDTPPLQVLGTSGDTAALVLGRWSADASNAKLHFLKSRAAIGSFTVVSADDALGEISWVVDDGADYNNVAARIQAFSDGTSDAGDTPGRLVFATAPDGSASPTERMRIDNVGKQLITFTSTYATTVASTVVFRHTTTGADGTVGNGIGQAMVFEQDVGTANNEIGFVINTIFEDTTSTSEDSAVRFDTMVAGAVTTASWVNRVKRMSAAHSVGTSVATEVTTLQIAAIQPGTYLVDYHLLNQSATTNTGLGLGIHFTGTATMNARRHFMGTFSSTAMTGIADDDSVDSTAQPMNVYATNSFSSTAPNMVSSGVTAAASDYLDTIHCILTVTVAGDLSLFHGSSKANVTRVSSNSIVRLERYA